METNDDQQRKLNIETREDDDPGPRCICHDLEWRYKEALDESDYTASEYPRTSARKIHQLAVLLREERSGTPIDQSAKDYFAIFRQARDIYNDRELRLEIEARILAKQDLPEVADAVQIDVRVIDQYVYYFFDVCGYLQARSRVMALAVDTRENASDPLRREVLRSDYFGGIVVVDFLFRRRDRPG